MTPDDRENFWLLIHFLLALAATFLFLHWSLGGCGEFSPAVPLETCRA